MPHTTQIEEELLEGEGSLECASEVETRLLKTSVIRTRLVRLAMRGLSAKEASKLVGIHEISAAAHYRDPEFRRAVLSRVDAAFAGTDAAFVEKSKTLTERIEEQASKSFEELVRMLDPMQFGEKINANLRYRINTQFLDRHAETATVHRSQVVIDPMQLKLAATAAGEMDKVVEIKRIA